MNQQILRIWTLTARHQLIEAHFSPGQQGMTAPHREQRRLAASLGRVQKTRASRGACQPRTGWKHPDLHHMAEAADVFSKVNGRTIFDDYAAFKAWLTSEYAEACGVGHAEMMHLYASLGEPTPMHLAASKLLQQPDGIVQSVRQLEPAERTRLATLLHQQHPRLMLDAISPNLADVQAAARMLSSADQLILIHSLQLCDSQRQLDTTSAYDTEDSITGSDESDYTCVVRIADQDDTQLTGIASQSSVEFDLMHIDDAYFVDSGEEHPEHDILYCAESPLSL